jgi:hypothetical protein
MANIIQCVKIYVHERPNLHQLELNPGEKVIQCEPPVGSTSAQCRSETVPPSSLNQSNIRGGWYISIKQEKTTSVPILGVYRKEAKDGCRVQGRRCHMLN